MQLLGLLANNKLLHPFLKMLLSELLRSRVSPLTLITKKYVALKAKNSVMFFFITSSLVPVNDRQEKQTH